MSAEQDINRQVGFEMEVANFLAAELNGFIAPKTPGRDKEKDCTLLTPEKLEVKYDEKAVETGNLFLEVGNPKLGETSGLTATSSDIWAQFVYPSRLFLFNPIEMLEHLRRMIKEGHPDYNYREMCGDKNSNGVIVPISEIKKLSFVKEKEFHPKTIIPKSTLAAA